MRSQRGQVVALPVLMRVYAKFIDDGKARRTWARRSRSQQLTELGNG